MNNDISSLFEELQLLDLEEENKAVVEADEPKHDSKYDNLALELADLEAEYERYNADKFYEYTYDDFESKYPEFAKQIKNYLKSMEILTPEEIKSGDLFDEYWTTGELILPEDWPALFSGCHKLINGKHMQWDREYVNHLENFEETDDEEEFEENSEDELD